MRVAAIDIGTNTCLLLIAEVVAGRVENVLHDEARVIRLGQDVNKTKRLHVEALARARQCFKDYSEIIKSSGAEKVQAVATSAARDSENAAELVALGAEFGIPIEVITGQQEADLTFWGTLRGDESDPIVIVDTGGGSTEYIVGDKHGLIARTSLDIGSVRLTELFVTSHPIDSTEMLKMSAYIQERILKLKTLLPPTQGLVIHAVAGTPTTLAAVEQERDFESSAVDGHVLKLATIRKFIQKLSAMTVAERQTLAGMEPKRADVIVAGALILMMSCQALGASSMQVSVRGLRYGLARKLGGFIS